MHRNGEPLRFGHRIGTVYPLGIILMFYGGDIVQAKVGLLQQKKIWKPYSILDLFPRKFMPLALNEAICKHTMELGKMGRERHLVSGGG